MAKSMCEIGHRFACNGVGVRRMSGVEKGDPKFRICLGCWAYLKRQGVRMKEANPTRKKNAKA